MENQGALRKAAVGLSLIPLMILASCKSATGMPKGSALRPTIAAEATNTPCPHVTPYPTATAGPPGLLFALVDKSKSYQYWTLPALDRFAEALPAILSPGDELIVAWVGTNSEDPTEVFLHQRAPYAPPPEIGKAPEFPTLIPTPTAYATPTYPAGGETTIQRKRHQDICESMRIENEQETSRVQQLNDLAINGYYCALQSWNASSETATRAWRRENERGLLAFVEEITTTLKAVDVGGYDDWTHVDEALWVASSVFQGDIARGQFERYKLVIFSDMEDDRLGIRHDLPLDFAEVDVVVAMFCCREAQKCEAEKDAWTAVFENAHARSVTFLLVADTTPDRLASALR
jgi:hypothetical protein